MPSASVAGWHLASRCLQSLQSNVGHKAQQLQELEHSHKASQGSIAQLQQQVVRLGGALPDRDDSCDSAVDVSLDAGLGLGPPQQCPESPAALQRRVRELEVRRCRSARQTGCWLGAYDMT